MKFNMNISPVDDCVWLNEWCTLLIDGDTPEEAANAAQVLNDSCRLTEESAKLREILEMVIFEAERNLDNSIDIDDLKEELSQLKDQNNGK